jgi:hypothetical protein
MGYADPLAIFSFLWRRLANKNALALHNTPPSVPERLELMACGLSIVAVMANRILTRPSV